MKCGVGDYTMRLSAMLSKQPDISAGVLTMEGCNAEIPDDRVEVIPIVRAWRMSEAIRILSAIRRWNPDVIHFQFPAQGYRGILPVLLPYLAAFLGKPIVQTWHEYLTKESRSLGMCLLLLSPGNIIAVRPNFQGHMTLFARLLVRRKKFWFIANAASIPRVRLMDSERKVVRERLCQPNRKLIAYFGFLYPHKGVDLLFDIADPDRHQIVLIGDIRQDDPYHRSILDRIQCEPWRGKASVTGFLPESEVARILAASDAVVLPFRDGGGMWNTSLHGAALQGTFVLTTSRERHGYDDGHNIYYARPDDMQDMQLALDSYLGRRNIDVNIDTYTTWNSVAAQHIDVYRTVLINGK
jgi:glycosyltransferase involved in cell wall biosynthesis